MVEISASAAVAEQAQCGHYRLFSLFEVREIQLAKNHSILDLCGINGSSGWVGSFHICTVVENDGR